MWTFSAVQCSYCKKLQLESLLLRNKLFSNFKLQKHCRIFFCCFRYRNGINEKIVDIVLLFLTSAIASLLLLAFTTWVLLEITASAYKNRVICGTEFRL